MRGTNYLLALTTTTDEVTGEVKPLFAFPVQICKGTEDKDERFDIAAPSGAPRVQKYVDSATGAIVEDSECLRGIRVSDDDFRVIPQETIDAINSEEKTTTIVALGSSPLAGLHERYGDRITGRYFVQSPAKGGSAKAYRLTYEALLADSRAIIVKRTKNTKQAMGFIYADADEGCLLFSEVTFNESIRHADELLRAPLKAEVADSQIAAARQVIANLPTGTDALDSESDSAQAAKRALKEKALMGETIAAPKSVVAEVAEDDLEAMLTASLGAK